MRSFLLALQFLTVIPVRVRGDIDGRAMASSVAWYPAVGVVVGGVVMGAGAAAGMVLPASIAAGLALMTWIAVSGGFHLDGLSDTADGLRAKGGRERMLAAMRDSAAGPIGVIAVVMALLLKYLAIWELARLDIKACTAALVMAPALGRWGMAAGIFHGRSARQDGLGSMLIGRIGAGAMCAATLMAGIIVIALPMIAPSLRWTEGLAIMGIAYALALAWGAVMNKAFGGQTGDTLGALGEITEIVVLMAVIAWSGRYTL